MKARLDESDPDRQRASFRPKDPVWAPTRTVEACRRALKAHDEFLDLWWEPLWAFGRALPGRWRIVRFLPTSGGHETMLAWEGPGRTYRDLPASGEALVLAVQAIPQCDSIVRVAKENASDNAAKERRDWDKSREGAWKRAVARTATERGLAGAAQGVKHFGPRGRRKARARSA